MSVDIRITRRTFVDVDGLFNLQFTCTDDTTGIDKNIFAFQVIAGKDPVFNHVCNPVDMSHLPTAPAIGYGFYRAATFTVKQADAFGLTDLEQRVFDDILQLQKNTDEIAGSFETDQNFQVTGGVLTDITGP